MGTRTCVVGLGNSWVGVRVGVNIPTGYPCRSLPTLQVTSNYRLLYVSSVDNMRLREDYKQTTVDYKNAVQLIHQENMKLLNCA